MRYDNFFHEIIPIVSVVKFQGSDDTLYKSLDDVLPIVLTTTLYNVFGDSLVTEIL